MVVTGHARVILQGMRSGLYVTQGYGSALAVLLDSDPDAVNAPIDTDATITVNVPSNWSTNGGSLVVAPDGLSAVWTAPSTPGVYTITITDQNDLGNEIVINATALSTSNSRRDGIRLIQMFYPVNGSPIMFLPIIRPKKK